jgi:hypothetical protein
LAPGAVVGAGRTAAHALTANTASVSDEIGLRQKGMASLVSLVSLIFTDVRLIESTTVADGRTTQTWYVGMDAGIVGIPRIGAASFYLGSNIYLRPVNKDAPLRMFPGWAGLSRRFAFTVGATFNSIKDKADGTGVRREFAGDKSLLLGAGLRLTESLRAGAGILLFRQRDPNPLITNESVTSAFYGSLSFDIDVVKNLAKAFGVSLQ